MFAADSGGASPQSSSISRSVETTSFACKRSNARTARCFAPEPQERPVRGDLKWAQDAEVELVRDLTVARKRRRDKLGEVRVGPGRPAPHVARCSAGQHQKGKTRASRVFPWAKLIS